MPILAEYCQVLQEESERVCGTALPPELIHLILFRWGGLEHPTATLIQGVMSRPHDIGPWRGWALPYSTIPRHVFGDVPSAETMADPATEFAAYITDCTLGLSNLSDDGQRARHELPDGRVFVYGLSLRLQNALAHSILDEGVWWLCGPPMFTHGVRCSQRALWIMAAQCRGMSQHHMRAFRRGPTPLATKLELCNLLRRAETDRSWRLWYDLARAHPGGMGATVLGSSVDWGCSRDASASAAMVYEK